ncbi:MAG TPA: acyl-CoA dehydrogenase family protein [Gaiellaceae bacterium]|nr:acyl-CoA dehydrogenase family protein [Gaiellaceae bacterium]
MDFSFTPEQEQLRREARSFLAANPEPTWEQLVELGWVGVSIPDEHGGLGLGFLEEAVLLEETARALMPGPWFATTVLAQPLLDAEQQARVAAGEERWSAVVDGLVPSLGDVDLVLTGGGVVPAEGETLRTMDETRPLGRLASEAGAAPVDTRRLAAACALEAVGVAQRALELGVEHATTREQFGRPIGVFQAVSHALANTFVETELARSLAYWAAWCVAVDDPRAALAASAAKAKATEAAVAACERSIQVLGGTGFTWEHVLHRLYKRAEWLESFGGYPSAHRAAVAAAIIDGVTERERDGLQRIVA